MWNERVGGRVVDLDVAERSDRKEFELARVPFVNTLGSSDFEARKIGDTGSE